MKVLFKHTMLLETTELEGLALVESLHDACHLKKGENSMNDLHLELYGTLGEIYKEFHSEYIMDYPRKNPSTELLD